EINGLAPDRRLAARRETIAPRVKDLIDWMTTERARLSGHNDVAKAMNYMLTRIDAFTRLLDDGRVCLTNNAAERSLRGIAIGRKAWLFAGSERGGERAAAMFTLIETAKLNGLDPQAWLADVLARIADHRITDLAALLPWNWRSHVDAAAAQPCSPTRPITPSPSPVSPRCSVRMRTGSGTSPPTWNPKTV